MTAPLFLVAPGALGDLTAGSSLLLDGPEGRHAATVRRIATGEVVLLADGTGRLADAVVIGVGRDELTLTIEALRDVPVPQPRFVLVQALAKGDRDDQAIEAATELGVDEVVPWQADRSIVQWRGDRGARAKSKWESVIRAAAKQSRRPTAPTVPDLVSRKSLCGRIARASLALLLHEDATDSLGGVLLPDDGDVLLVVGPEGGISPEELAAFIEAGGVPVRMGPTVLRSSSAGPAALAVLAARTRW